jgi:hypothetical protein
MSWGYWGIITGVLVLLTVFFFCIDLLYRDQKRGLGTGRPGDAERPSGSRHAA